MEAFKISLLAFSSGGIIIITLYSGSPKFMNLTAEVCTLCVLSSRFPTPATGHHCATVSPHLAKEQVLNGGAATELTGILDGELRLVAPGRLLAPAVLDVDGTQDPAAL